MTSPAPLSRMPRLAALEVEPITVKTAVSYMAIELNDWVVIIRNVTSRCRRTSQQWPRSCCVRLDKTVNGGEIMYRQGGSRAEMWRLKSVPPVAFNQERPNLTEGGLDVQCGYLPPCSQGLFRRRDERPRGGPSVRATPGHGAQDARVLRAPRVSTATTGLADRSSIHIRV